MMHFANSCAVSRCFRAAIVLAGVLALTNAPSILGQTNLTPTVVLNESALAAPSTNLTPCTCIDEVIQRVKELPIQPNELHLLKMKLKRARSLIAVCDVITACKKMVKFDRQTEALVSIGALDQAVADSLAVCARTIDLCGHCYPCIDNQPPVALAKSLVLSADSLCQADPDVSEFDNGSYDPDGIIASRSVTPTGPYSIGETLLTYTVVDNCGASNSVSTSVVVKDTAGPSVSNFSPVFPVFVTPGESSGTAIFPDPVISNRCSGVASWSFSPPSGSVFPLGVTPAALIVVDSLGNTNQIVFYVVVLPNSGSGSVSNLPPFALAQAVTNAADAHCQAVVTPDQVDNHSFSLNGIIVGRFVDPAGPFPAGSVTLVTLTVVDNWGVSNSAATTVTVLDRTPPSILTPPMDIEVTTPPDQTTAIVNYPTLSVTDNCSSVGVTCTPPSGSAFPVGTTNVTCQVFDGAGNTNSTAFQVTVTGYVCNTIPGLIQRVQAIPLTLYFNAGRQSSMLSMLERAQLSVTLGRLSSAKYLLAGFIIDCSVSRDVGILDVKTATKLINCATNIKSHLFDPP